MIWVGLVRGQGKFGVRVRIILEGSRVSLSVRPGRVVVELEVV